MAGFVKVATVDEIPEGGMKRVDTAGRQLVVANVGGKFFAMGRICTHKGAPLDEGELDGRILTCPWHGAKFDVTTGKVVQGPAQKDEPVCEVKVQGKDILVKL